MLIAIIVLSFITVFAVAICLNYRKRINDICSQINYIRQHETNMMVTSDYGNTASTKLACEMNELLVHTAELRKQYSSRESSLRNTITSLSHDIRTPLTSLDGYFQLLNECDSPEEREKYIAIIRERIDSLKMMLEELFMYSKLQDNSYVIELEALNLNKILYESTFSFYDDFKNLNIEPDISIPEKPIDVLCNYAALKRAIQNIIKNGLEHGEDYFSICLDVIDDHPVITFKNRYRGSDDIDVVHVFDKFYKADSSRRKTSTGLGLAITKEIIDKMDGTITAKTQEDLFVIEIHLPSKK